MKILSAGLAAIFLTFSLSVQAETSSSQKVSGFYIGGGIGNPSGKLDEADRELKDKSYHVIAGYQEGRIFSWEMQYAKYGKDTYEFFDPSSFFFRLPFKLFLLSHFSLHDRSKNLHWQKVAFMNKLLFSSRISTLY